MYVNAVAVMWLMKMFIPTLYHCCVPNQSALVSEEQATIKYNVLSLQSRQIATTWIKR